MDRNLFNRVEACFPIEDPASKKRIYQLGLLNYLKIINRHGCYRVMVCGNEPNLQAAGEEPHNAQQILLDAIK